MQTIGKMDDGRVLVLPSALEYDILEKIGEMIAAKQFESSFSRPAPAVAAHSAPPTAKQKTTSATKSPPPRAATTEPAKPLCLVCQKPLQDTRGGRKVHKGKCTMEHARTYAREAWRAKHGAKPRQQSAAATTMPPNPSSPFMTDEQRKEFMARREKLIAAAAQRHAED